MNLHTVFPHGDVCRMRIDPGSAVKIVDSVLVIVLVQGIVSMAAEDASCLTVMGMGQGARSDLRRQGIGHPQ